MWNDGRVHPHRASGTLVTSRVALFRRSPVAKNVPLTQCTEQSPS